MGDGFFEGAPARGVQIFRWLRGRPEFGLLLVSMGMILEKDLVFQIERWKTDCCMNFENIMYKLSLFLAC